jgi:putative transposase
VKGRKRHLLVATQGLVLKVLVHAADLHDRDSGQLLLEALQRQQAAPEQFPRLRHL